MGKEPEDLNSSAWLKLVHICPVVVDGKDGIARVCWFLG